MKSKILTSLLAISSFTATITSFLSATPAKAGSLNFFCGTAQGAPTTIVKHPRHGNLSIIRWTSNFGSNVGYTPQRRCNEVTNRFQKYHNQGQLKYLTTGKINGQQVICVTNTQGGNCQGLLYTVKPNDKASQRLKRLIERREKAQGPSMEENFGNNGSSRYYANFETLVEALAENSSPNNQLDFNTNMPQKPQQKPDSAPNSDTAF